MTTAALAGDELRQAANRPFAGARIGPLAAMVLIALVNMLNVMDRKIVGILAEPIKRDLRLTDGQVGILTGFAFSIVYAACAVPIARLADRGDRANVLAIALAVWSVATGACGIAGSFALMVCARMMVAAGESACSPASYALVADYFSASNRVRAMATISVATALGTLISFAAGGYIAQALSWRAALLLVGIPGIVLALAIWRFLPEPRRNPSFVAAEPRVGGQTMLAAVRALVRRPTFILIVLGACAIQFALNSVLLWSAALLQRAFAWQIGDAGLALGLTFGISGMLSPIAVSWLGDRRFARDAGAYPFILAVLCVMSAPILVIGLLAANAWLALAMIALAYLLTSGWLAPVLFAVRSLTSSREMALATAVLGVCFNLLGIGLGPVVVGFLSDMLRPTFGADAVRYALLPSAVAYLLGAVALFAAARNFRRGVDPLIEDPPSSHAR